jgi:hypothetical protein
MLVSLAHGSPSHNRFSILKNYDFPFINRTNKPITQEDITNYLKATKGKPAAVRYASFHLLITIAKMLDIDNSIIIARAVE